MGRALSKSARGGSAYLHGIIQAPAIIGLGIFCCAFVHAQVAKKDEVILLRNRSLELGDGLCEIRSKEGMMELKMFGVRPGTYVRVKDTRNWLFMKTGVIVETNKRAAWHLKRLGAKTVPVDFGVPLSGTDRSIFLNGYAKRHTHDLMGILDRETGFFVVIRDLEILEVPKNVR